MKRTRSKNAPKRSLVCLCNSVDEQTIREAIQKGARTLDEIFDFTSAGVGACGGSCRPQLRQLLETELAQLKSK